MINRSLIIRHFCPLPLHQPTDKVVLVSVIRNNHSNSYGLKAVNKVIIPPNHYFVVFDFRRCIRFLATKVVQLFHSAYGDH